MSVVEQMLDTYPRDLGDIDKNALASCIKACVDCAQACTACADACLSEDMVAELTKCIRTNLDCADVCEATGRVLSRTPGTTPRSLTPCSRRVRWSAKCARTIP